MRKVLILPVLAAALFAAGCDQSTGADASANVRFLHATTGMTGNGSFTSNGQFVAGSTLALGQATESCSRLGEGSTTFAFGYSNSGGDGLNGSPLSTLNDLNLPVGGNYTVAAAGSRTSPTLFLLDNDFTDSLASNQAAVRFVNYAPGPNQPPYVYNAFTSWPPVEGSLFASNILFGSPTPFKIVASGPASFSVILGHEIPTLTTISVELKAGTANTIAIVPSASGGIQLVHLPRCS